MVSKKNTALEAKNGPNWGVEPAAEIRCLQQPLLIKQNQETKWWLFSLILSLNVIWGMEELHSDQFCTWDILKFFSYAGWFNYFLNPGFKS